MFVFGQGQLAVAPNRMYKANASGQSVFATVSHLGVGTYLEATIGSGLGHFNNAGCLCKNAPSVIIGFID